MEIKDLIGGSKEELLNWFEAIVDSVHNGVIAINNDGRIIIFNQSSESLLGIKKGKALGRPIEKVIPETDFKDILSSKKDQPGYHLKIKDKEIYSNRTLISYEGDVVGAIAVFQDITELNRIKCSLERAEDDLGILEAIINSAYEGIIIVDNEGRITKLNQAYQEFLGIKEENVLGNHITDVIENTRMHIVAKSGKEEIGHVQRIQGYDMIASRIPFKRDGRVAGAVGKVLFQDIKELNALAKRLESLEDKLDYYKNEIKSMQKSKYSFDNIITRNKRMEYLKEVGMRAAESSSTVLIQGESGTGKELFAHAIHKASHRKYGAFIRVNCAAIPENLLESELFGYEKGAFTGANAKGKAGKFELAHGGTIFLDEIGEMPLDMQVKLLRVLQEREVERVGGGKTIDIDIRVIAATNEDLEEMVSEGKFRKDLYYRLNVIRLSIPPLRDRLNDIPLLSKAILKNLVEELDLGPKELSTKSIMALMNYDWPGNVRELRNFLERAINLTSERIIHPSHLPDILGANQNKVSKIKKEENWNLKNIVVQTEVNTIKQVLKETDGNRTEAAKLLGIHRTSLYNKIDSYGIDMSNF
ncbi:sigma-54 interaction domain-containing protein [Halonatronum saccharophilum]|uniref:sigma-54 interaction domain-containing protein n=1 Tax=Halonatronum saccharophilum TaxID=150060 RepID=UPI0004B9600F|nr:sigma-54-dependent Fis family transcriptional regulator [Halonatronum saccharophilum]